MPFEMTPASAADYDQILKLNQAELPHVGDLSRQTLEELIGFSYLTLTARSGHSIAGFIVALLPGQAYASQNYRWFSDSYPSFLYVDRIVVAPEFKGQGLGRALYEAVAADNPVNAPLLCCEVNLKPLNQDSLDFHARLGFEEVGQQETEAGKKRVSLLVRPL